MNEKYFPEEIEEKQQRRWAAAGAFNADVDTTKEKFYCLEMLPYPSGKIHMGHVRNYSIGDALSAYKRMQGFNVLHPMGWDSFGMPAENAAIKNNSRPDTWTFENINAMRVQLQRLGFSYDWRRDIATCSPEYYRWNQWFFIQMWKHGLLYRKNATVNWCVKCNTSLANEQAEGGFCWRHEDVPVELRELEQWFIRVSKYADELLESLDTLEGGWPERVLAMQRNWIGRSKGAEVDFRVAYEHAPTNGKRVRVFTTRIDTIFGASCVIVAPEHELVEELMASGKASDELNAFAEKQKSVSKEDRIAEGTAKEGVNTGLFAVNPFNGERLPIWTANFVLTGYGTGAIMAVPAHDERDFEFCTKYGLPIPRVIKLADSTEADDAPVTEAFTNKDDSAVVINSGKFSGMKVPDAIKAMIEYAEEGGFGEAKTNFKIRDWGVSRQRAWGTPLPFVHCAKCGIVPVPDDQLPVELPNDLNFNTQGAPLAEHAGFVNTPCPTCGEAARRDTDTMDTFVDSSWYYFRYVDPKNESLPFAPEVAAYWTPVDQYIGGIEHAVLHLIYTRLWTKIMRDLGLITFGEPVTKLLTQGMVCLASARCEEHDWIHPSTEVVDGKCKFCGRPAVIGRIEKMSKNKKNTVDPDEMIKIYGADTVRLFMMFAAPPEKDLEWSEAGAEGASRFLNRVWRIIHKWHDKLSGSAEGESSDVARSLRRKTHQTIKRISNDIGERMNFNTAVAALMELTNEIYAFDNSLKEVEASASDKFALKEAMEALAKMLSPFTPHIAEELWANLGHNEIVVTSTWPEYDADLAKADELEIPVQLNGKLVARLIVPAEASDEELKAAALANDRVKAKLEGRQIVKTIVVPKRLVNLVAK
jgi:leucyl-tRNA synthetase